MTDDEKERYRARFHDARSPEQLLALGKELAGDFTADPFALSLGEMVANAIAAEKPELLGDYQRSPLGARESLSVVGP